MSEITLLSPKMDFIFKKIFGNEKNPEILISFLNSILQEIDPITNIEIRNSNIEKEYLEDKYGRLDIKATTNRGELINIEIQVKNEYNMIKRSLYYWGRMYTGQLSSGEDYELLQRTVCINILDFKYIDDEDYHTSYRIKNTKTTKDLTDLLELHFIELPKFQLCNEDIELEVWLEFIKNPISEVVRKKEKSNKAFKQATDELYLISSNSDDIEKYRFREDSLREKNSLIAASERKEKIKNIKNILDVLDDETIADKFNFDIMEVKKLRAESLSKQNIIK